MNVVTTMQPERPISIGGRLLAQRAHDSLETNGFVEVEVDPGETMHDYQVVKEGMRYITDHPDLHASLPWRTFELDAYGYDYRQEVGLSPPNPNKDDRKFRFQYTPDMKRSVPSDVLRIFAVDAMFQALERIDGRAREIAAAVAMCYDVANNAKPREYRYAGKLANRLDGGRIITRVLRYGMREDQAPDAKLHVDRSFLTVHNWSSHPGLCVFGPDGTSYTVHETSPKTVAVFGGEKLAATTRARLGYGTPHGVRDERRTNGTHDEDRYAIVSFVHCATRADDAAWLLANRHRIESYEASFAL